MIRNGADDDIYVLPGNNSNYFYKYSISNNSWTSLANVPVPIGVGSGGFMIRNGADDDIYVLPGNNSNYFYKYSISNNSWTSLANVPVPIGVGSGGFMIRNGADDDIYVLPGNNSDYFYKYSISNNSWTSLANVPVPRWHSGVSWGAFMIRNGADNDIYVLLGDNSYAFAKYLIPQTVYYSSGTFTSGVIDTGQTNFAINLTWDTTGSGASTTITMDARAGNTPTVDGSWTAWQTSITSSSNISALAGYRYVQYRANLSTANTAQTPYLNSVTIGYNYYPTGQYLISSVYDTGLSVNVMGSINWDENVPASSTISLSLRTASSSDNLASSPWIDFTNSTTNCFKNAGSVSCGAAALPASVKDGIGDQFFQYKATLNSDGLNVPSLSEVRIQYVINAPPEFNPAFGTNGITVSQISSSTDPNNGKVIISYSIRDPDTTTGSPGNQGYVTPSFEYNVGGGWQVIPSSTLAAGDTDRKEVSEVSFTNYTAIWDAPNLAPGVYTTGAQIRITINDNEAANNTTSSVSTAFVLDTKSPTVSTFSISGTSTSLSLNISDNTGIFYRLSNNSDFSSDGINPTSGQWQSASSTNYDATTTWVLPSGNYPTVYLQVKDNLGNSTTTVAVAPTTPAGFELKDISNMSAGILREFISWGVYVPTSTAQFASYKIYRSTDGETYNLFNTITDINLNYYLDTAVNSSTVYYYKIAIADTNGDISPYSITVSDRPDGQGGTDTTPPTISNVVVAQTQSTWAKITWTTDEISDTEVNFSANSPTYLVTQSVNTMVVSHSIIINGLSPNTLYYFRVKSKDIFNNQGINDNNGNGYQFTTVGGPIISNVTAIPGDRSATIVWNTNTDSDSYVDYSVSPTLSGATEIGSAALVGGVSSSTYEHRVVITGLNPGVDYYYYVKSTDAMSNTSIDNNNGAYYHFNTTYDVTPPKISEVDTPVLTSAAAVIVWSTDEPATSQVYYKSASSTSYSYTTLDSTLTRAHVATLSSLSSETPYSYYVESKDEAQNRATSSVLTFTTTAPGAIQYVAIGGGGSIANDTTPPKISNIQVSSITAFGATITFDTDEPATAFVLYGKDQQYGATAGSDKLSTSHSITLSGLRLGTTYHFAVEAQDKAGNFSTSEDQTFTTKYIAESSEQLKQIENAAQFEKEIENSIETILPSLLPPFIEEPKVVDITENSAKIIWRTNVKSFSVVSYASESDYNASTTTPYNLESSDVVNKTTEHEINLSGLRPNTRYHYKVKSFRIPDVVGTSDDLTFITKAAKVQAIITDVKNNSFNVTWTTDELASSIVEYKNLSTGEIFRKTEEEMRNSHSMLVDNLIPATTYEVSISGYNKNGNLIEGGEKLRVTTSRDVTPPIISGFKVDNALVPGRNDRIQTIIFWKTDEPANSVVYFNEGSAPNSEFQNKVENLNSYITDHTIILSNFKPATIYQIKIVSYDQSGNKAVFGPRTIITPAQSESIFNIIFKNFEDTFKFLRGL